MTCPNVVAIVPMRHVSERVPGKNYRSFCGRPLYRHVVGELLACELISEVVIDTDSPIIRADAAKHFAEVRFVDRPGHLRGGKTSMNDVLLHTTSVIDADYYFQTHSTNPLLCAQTISRAIEALLTSRSKHDSLFSVTPVQARLWDREARAINHDPAVLLRTQDLPPTFLENSSIYLFDRPTLQLHRNRIGLHPLMFEMTAMESIDIDTESDFQIAELLYAQQRTARRREAVA
jgi:CMP-N-acetylneuraminic acid synthetase